MARRLEITDAQWKAFEPILSSDRKKMGRPRNDDRKTFNGIYWVLHTGVPWRDVPEMYGKWQTVYKRFAQWQESGQLEAFFNELRKDCDMQDIESEAFAGINAQVIVIPATCEYVADDAFNDCEELQFIVNHSNVVITAPEKVKVISEP